MNADPKFAYRESAARAASPVGRVVLLYEQAIQDLGAAIAAIGNRDVEVRTQQLNHALLVIGQLQACLDLDRGGEVGRNLDRFYGLMRSRLLAAQLSGSGTILREQMDLLLSLRAAWIEVESAESQSPGVGPSHGAVTLNGDPAAPGASTRWRA